jgi:hypothetical protein
MDRFIVAAFVATFIAAIAAVVGVPVLAQNVPAGAPPMSAPSPEGAFRDPPRMGPKERFAAMDTDHDGRISKAEWLAAGRKERGFAMMDADGDGYLTMDEIKAGREKMRAMREAKGKE